MVGKEIEKEKDMEKGKLVFLSYKNDDDIKINGYVYLIKMDDNVITFRKNFNIITIPISRLLKMKESEK